MVYRNKAETEAWRQRDPITTFRQRLLQTQVASEADLTAIEAQVQATLDEAVEFAASSPQPEPESALEGVYHDTHEGRVF
jgi:pyruvate dehydrogenase E1 component alpha subunit